MKKGKNKKFIFKELFCWLGLLTMTSCTTHKYNFTTTPTVQKSQAQFSLNRATLEQSDNKGLPLWKIEVSSTIYSPDNQKVEVKNVRGNLFQNGKIVLEISSREGEIYRNGQEVDLKDNIIAVDPRNKITINANRMKWTPKTGILTLWDDFTAYHEDISISGTKALYQSKTQVLNIFGKIFGISSNHKIELKTDHLQWLVAQHKIIGDHPIQLIRYQDKLITDLLNAKRIEMNIQQNTILSQETLNFKSIKPTVDVLGNNFLWNYKDRNVISKQPAQFTDYKQNMTVTGNQSFFDQNKQLLNLKGNFHAISLKNQTQLYAQEGIWHLQSKIIDASGNVDYRQIHPQLHVVGERAVGILQNNNVIVTPHAGGKVMTEFYPDKKRQSSPSP